MLNSWILSFYFIFSCICLLNTVLSDSISNKELEKEPSTENDKKDGLPEESLEGAPIPFKESLEKLENQKEYFGDQENTMRTTIPPQKTLKTSLIELTRMALQSLKSYKESVIEILEELRGPDVNENKDVDDAATEKSSQDQEDPVAQSIQEDGVDELVRNDTNVTIVEIANVTINGTSVNGTSANATEANGKRKITCVPQNRTDANYTAVVKIVDSATLQAQFRNETDNRCFIVMFYAPWCSYCADAAPPYNALARAFPQLDILAVDAVYFSSLNAKFGTMAVPNILIFHNGRPVSRFNGTERTLENYIYFVSNVTKFNATQTNITDEDYISPLSSTPTEETDYLLTFAWFFVIVYGSYLLARCSYGQRCLHMVQNLWQEHQHLD